MTSDACREFRAALGAAALSGLDGTDDPALRAHLDGCADCRAELRELTAVARSLPLADPRRGAEVAAEPPPGLADRVRDRLAQQRAERRRRHLRRVTVGVAAALIAALVALGAVLALHNPSPAMTEVTFPTTPDVSARASLRERPSGTEVVLHVRGLHDGDVYWLWLADAHDKRTGAGTFRATQSPIDVTLTAALPLNDTRRIWVTDADEQVVLDSKLPTD
jgi:hypothetical protein